MVLRKEETNGVHVQKLKFLPGAPPPPHGMSAEEIEGPVGICWGQTGHREAEICHFRVNKWEYNVRFPETGEREREQKWLTNPHGKRETLKLNL